MLAALTSSGWLLASLLVVLAALVYAVLVVGAAALRFRRWVHGSEARQRVCLVVAATTLAGGCAAVDGPSDEPWRQWLQSQGSRDGHAAWVRNMKRSQL